MITIVAVPLFPRFQNKGIELDLQGEEDVREVTSVDFGVEGPKAQPR